MAVTSCKAFDETTSWRGNNDVINMTKSATTAGDILSNNRLDENCNNNNNRKGAQLVNTSEEIYAAQGVKLQRQEEDSKDNRTLPVSQSRTEESDVSNETSSENMKLKLDCEPKEISEIPEDVSLRTDLEITKVSDAIGVVETKSEGNTADPQQVLADETRPTSGESVHDEDEQSVVAEDQVIRDPEWIEERFRVDRRKLEQMLQAAANGTGQSGDDFFSKIMAETATEVTWPSKLKIGAKSKKDPHIKVCGKQADVKRAKALVMQVLDTKCTRVTLKMDVSHTEHSHVIGKGGNNIKRVMEETGCHIHFPDSNRNSTAEKSNQVSIAGQPAGVENARSKIRELLPIVITFDLSMSGTIPDPNSPPIQHIVQTYNISVQFKQRLKAYCTTTCTVRGSNDNISGLVEGTIKLMQHLTGGQVVRVTSQMEVAPQQHSYMLGRNASNVSHIMQRTGAQISFPDPNCVPKKSTIFITGTVEQVVMARQRLMGCLPLVLMFDMKQDDNVSPTDETIKNGNLMESLDVFISIKLKPKQPSKSVIVKSVERNIFNMFDARRQLLKLPSTGLKTPPPPSSPPPLNITSSSSVTGTPMIRLSHAPSPHIKPQYISIIQPNGVALMNGSMSPLPRSATPTGTTVLRPNWSHSPMPSPSQSPFPMSQQATVAAIQAQQHQHLLLQAQIAQQQQMAAVLASASQASSMAGSPPNLQKSDDIETPSDPLQVTQQFIQENRSRRDSQTSFQARSEQAAPFDNQPQGKGEYPDSWTASPESKGGSPTSNYYKDPPDIPGNVRNLQRHVLAVQNHIEGRISANNSFNKGNSDKRLVHSHSFSDSNLHPDEFPTVNPQPRLSLGEGMENVPKTFLRVNSPKRGPLSLHSSPPGSDRNSPMSDRMNDFQTKSPDNDLNKQSGKLMKSPSSSSSSTDLQTALRHLHNSPTRGQYLHPDRREAHQLGRMEYMGSSEKHEAERRDEYFKGDSPAPPPGFDNFPVSTHSPLTESKYEKMRQKAYEAMQKGPVASEVRTPTSIWFGQGFSRSMPNHEWNRLDINNKYKHRLDTNYERDDSSLQEDAESAEPNHHAMSQHLANSSKGSSALLSWREKNSHNLSHSKELGNLPLKRRQHSTFDPLPDEYMNQSRPPPPHPNDDTHQSFPPQTSEAVPRLQHIANQPLEAALSLLTNNHLGGQSNCVELHDLLSHLNLEKYSEVFTKQEVDLQTFLTLTESDLTELGITVFGPRRKILLAIEKLKKN